MQDSYSRNIQYMRISITNRCNYQCVYCNPDGKFLFQEELSYREILDICKTCVKLGIVHFKITGGEPCIRNGYIDFMKELKSMEGVESVTLTTNGSLFSKQDLEALTCIDCINFSIDSLDSEAYYKITGRNCLDVVLDNLEYAYSLHIPVKVNCVVDDSFSISRLSGLLNLIQSKKIALRFIEQMPLSTISKNSNFETLIEYLNTQYTLHPYTQKLGNGPATYYTIDGYDGYLGLIQAMHSKFCSTCNRVRLSCSGYLQLCLYHKDGICLKNVENLEETIRSIIQYKPKEHDFDHFHSVTKMKDIGG